MADVTVVKGRFSNNEILVYEYLTKTMRLNNAASCGIMANIYHESSFNHIATGDSGTSYGLCQWHATRYGNLRQFTAGIGVQYNTVLGQMRFLHHELQTSYSSLLTTLQGVANTVDGAMLAAKSFCTRFERPANASVKAQERANTARNQYWPIYSGKSSGGGNGSSDGAIQLAVNFGKTIVEIARKQVGKPYGSGSTGPDSFDEAGLVYYSYTEAGVSISDMSMSDLYNSYKSIAQSVSSSAVSAADLLFYKDGGVIDRLAIATGEGGCIYSSPSYGKVLEDGSIGNPTYILRLVSSIYTDSSITPGLDPEAYTSLTLVDPYSQSVSANLSRVEATGFDYGYLIDLTHGGEFKFYIPEFTEQAGANWNPIDIRGRSVKVQSYESTNSRQVSISLDLYAGVGVYTATSGESGSDTISRLHRDANFLKSLEYPDYSNVITRPPSTVHLILGSVVDIVGVVSGVLVEHRKPVDSLNRSMYIKVSFTVTQIAVNPPDYKDIREGQYSIAATSDVSSILSGGTTIEEESSNTPNYSG